MTETTKDILVHTRSRRPPSPSNRVDKKNSITTHVAAMADALAAAEQDASVAWWCSRAM